MRLNLPLTGAEELAAVAEVLESGYLTQGPKAATLEALVNDTVGTEHAFAVSSATTGLHLALVGLGVKPDDEVIIPDFSFPATANVVVQLGAIPVFVDIEPDTFNLAPALLEAAITPRTAAIMPVHAFGLTADMDPINHIAAVHGIPVLEDAACALTALYNGRPAGSLGTAGVFSFHPRKIITTGEGGMITTNDSELAARMRVLRTHGAVRDGLFMSFVDAGFNYRLSDVHAAIGIAQMAKLDHIVGRRQTLASALTERIGSVEGVTAPVVPEGSRHSFQSYVVTLDEDIDRDAVICEMRELDVETTLGTYSMHLQPYFRERFGIPDEALPNATRAHRSALTLPLYPQLSESDVDRVAESLRLAVERVRSAPAAARR
ncbi:DegT/DnrJ/EryC1/StrS family aminotransferase [Microbacterium sp. STN6]|uniref:DegT/DnrJ/EryC1/StrS family aminotransferase n=1 Tax=Microbacterium sp. STN6 TaxID=2995588 RepID=UPI002260DF65|nr:DegT/DnrJ/EryC1/StrS family aminotransferase [Microbacterium sp. STN6]MCX7521045.1 DegT/DnrJ/EryC1/StrS family aminotransferase [Microbacterium sp. STN6]